MLLVFLTILILCAKRCSDMTLSKHMQRLFVDAPVEFFRNLTWQRGLAVTLVIAGLMAFSMAMPELAVLVAADLPFYIELAVVAVLTVTRLKWPVAISYPMTLLRVIGARLFMKRHFRDTRPRRKMRKAKNADDCDGRFAIA